MFEFMDYESPAEAPVEKESGRLTILVADSDVGTRLAIKSMLRNDYDVHLARTGDEALEMYEKLSPALLIVDILMPGIDGFEVLDIIDRRGIRKGRIVACTERIVETEPEYLMKYGFDDYLAKPVKSKILRMVVGNNME
jgi:CheY-like chemotaxis protein